jgi:hypothetical protein
MRHGTPEGGRTSPTPDPAERIRRNYVEDANGCWLWQGPLTAGGYGTTTAVGKKGPAKAHRVAYEVLVGPIPDGLHLDHLCHNADLDCPGGRSCVHRRCVRPDHLEPVTLDENNRRIMDRVARLKARSSLPSTP